MAINIKPLNGIARAIGYVCIFWAWLERGTDEMLEALIPTREVDPKKADILRALTSSWDMRDKVQIIRAVAFIRKLDDKWFERLDAVLKEIDDKIRPMRNRIVHDAWAKPGRGLVRVQKRIKFTKPQSFARELSTEERVPVKLPEVWSLAVRILRSQIVLVKLQMEFEAVRKFIDDEVEKRVAQETVAAVIATLASLQSKSSQQSPHPQTASVRPGKNGSRRKRPPEPSSG